MSSTGMFAGSVFSGSELDINEAVGDSKIPRQRISNKWALSPSAKISKKELSPLPYGMHGAQIVTIGDIIYVGGGITNRNDGVNFLVFKYIYSSNVWYVLQPCPVTHFGLAAVDGCPVTFGGNLIANGGEATDKCFTFHEESNEWKETLPPMPKQHSGVRSTSNEHCVVCVAEDQLMVYTLKTKKWSMSNYTTGNETYWSKLQPVMIDKLYIYSSFNRQQKIYTIEHPDDQQTAIKSSVSHSMHNLKSVDGGSSLMTFGGILLYICAVKRDEIINYTGKTRSVFTNVLFIYSSLSETWIPLAEGFLNPVVKYPASVTLSDGSILVIGGIDEQERSSNKVNIIEFV